MRHMRVDHVCAFEEIFMRILFRRVHGTKARDSLQVEKAGTDGKWSRRPLAVRELASLLGTGDQDVLQCFILVVAPLLDPVAVRLRFAVSSARR
jgi:hypothetical protein